MLKPKEVGLILRCLVIAFSIIISACTSKLHVRLFTENLSDKDLAQIEQKFRSSKVLYTISSAMVPESITSNAIVYTPTFNSNKRIYDVIDILATVDFTISWTSLLKVENHSFSANNIGLYLFSNGFVPAKARKGLFEVNEYGSVECASNLVLNTDLTFDVGFDIWDESRGDYRELSVNGSWQEQGADQIVLNSDSWLTVLKFEKRESVESSTEGNIKIFSLEPLLKNKDIGFYLKEPDSQPNINCSYQVTLFN